MILLKKLFRTMLEKKAQLLSAWLLVVISSMLFYSCTVAGVNLIGNLNQFFDTHHVEDASFVMEKPLDNERMLEGKYNIRIEKRVYADVSVENNSVLRLVNATTYINQYSVINGSKLENDDDILIDPSFAKAHNLSIGQNITLNGQSFKIKGMMAVPDYIYSIKSVSGFLKNPNDFGLAVVREDAITQMIGANLYYSVLLNNANIDNLKKDLSRANHILQWVDKKDNNRISFIKGDINAVKQMGETLPIGILFVTIVIILILLWRLLKKEYLQIGTLHALGYRRREILFHYMEYAGFWHSLGALSVQY